MNNSTNGLSPTEVSLREFVQDKINALRELIEARMKGSDKARKLQAREYARRLKELNHAHEQRLEHDADYVSNDKFETFQKEFREYKTTTEAALQLAAGARKGINNTIVVIVGAFGFVLTLGLIAVAFISIWAFFNTQRNAERIPNAATQPQPIYIMPSPSPTPAPILKP